MSRDEISNLVAIVYAKLHVRSKQPVLKNVNSAGRISVADIRASGDTDLKYKKENKINRDKIFTFDYPRNVIVYNIIIMKNTHLRT